MYTEDFNIQNVRLFQKTQHLNLQQLVLKSLSSRKIQHSKLDTFLEKFNIQSDVTFSYQKNSATKLRAFKRAF